VEKTVSLRRLILAALMLSAPLFGSPRDEVDTCLGCHADKDLSMSLESGEKQKLFVDRAVFEASVHGAKFGCTSCHPGHGDYPHPELKAKSAAELSAFVRQACASCHADKYAKSLDGLHETARASGNTSAPGCVDCHGSHEILRPDAPRGRIVETCSACHSDVADVYAKSVHGQALQKGNADVPTCVDCHRAHDNGGPRRAGWRLATFETCGACHGDRARMQKYGISADVLTTYLSDFHGMSATLSKGSKNSTGKVVAVCVDCHGSHDIQRVREAGSTALQANLAATCKKCHAGASASFPAAWLSHYIPSAKRAPLVYAVGVFYKVFIPFIIGGLVLQILLHLWRVVVNK
jgi:hypothetical protein